MRRQVERQRRRIGQPHGEGPHDERHEHEVDGLVPSARVVAAIERQLVAQVEAQSRRALRLDDCHVALYLGTPATARCNDAERCSLPALTVTQLRLLGYAIKVVRNWQATSRSTGTVRCRTGARLVRA